MEKVGNSIFSLLFRNTNKAFRIDCASKIYINYITESNKPKPLQINALYITEIKYLIIDTRI